MSGRDTRETLENKATTQIVMRGKDGLACFYSQQF